MGYGGGILNDSDGALTVTDSTISGNTAGGYGGGILNDGTLTVSNSTLAETTPLGWAGRSQPGHGHRHQQHSVAQPGRVRR